MRNQRLPLLFLFLFAACAPAESHGMLKRELNVERVDYTKDVHPLPGMFLNGHLIHYKLETYFDDELRQNMASITFRTLKGHCDDRARPDLIEFPSWGYYKLNLSSQKDHFGNSCFFLTEKDQIRMLASGAGFGTPANLAKMLFTAILEDHDLTILGTDQEYGYEVWKQVFHLKRNPLVLKALRPKYDRTHCLEAE